MKKEKLKVDIDKRTYDFALEVIKFIKFIRIVPKEMTVYELSRQLIRSATSIAANVEEAQGAFSKGDFTYKMSIAFKEARESCLWLRLLYDANVSNGKLKTKNEDLIKESLEIRNILGTIVKKSRDK